MTFKETLPYQVEMLSKFVLTRVSQYWDHKMITDKLFDYFIVTFEWFDVENNTNNTLYFFFSKHLVEKGNI